MGLTRTLRIRSEEKFYIQPQNMNSAKTTILFQRPAETNKVQGFDFHPRGRWAPTRRGQTGCPQLPSQQQGHPHGTWALLTATGRAAALWSAPATTSLPFLVERWRKVEAWLGQMGLSVSLSTVRRSRDDVQAVPSQEPSTSARSWEARP